MRYQDLDIELQRFIKDGVSDKIGDFCPEQVLDYLMYAMILFSGYESEEFAAFASAAKQMVGQEVSSHRWDGMSAGESEVAGIIALRAKEDILRTDADVCDPEKVYMVIGLYVYATVVCNDGLDGVSFVRLFVRSWIVYFSDRLSMKSAMPSTCS